MMKKMEGFAAWTKGEVGLEDHGAHARLHTHLFLQYHFMEGSLTCCPFLSKVYLKI
jgi:hypothetical protein